MSTERTAQDWLAIPEQDLPTELAKAVTPGPWKHKRGERGKCLKCGRHVSTVAVYEPVGCNVPDRIKIDWNTAKYWQLKCNKAIFADRLLDIYRETCTADSIDTGGFYVIYKYTTWLRELAQPKHYLIAAAMAAERKEE